MPEAVKSCPGCGAKVDNPRFQFCPYCQKPLALLGQHYRLERSLEEGAHGVVYLAHRLDRDPSTKYAAKVLKRDALEHDGLLIKRFQKEVRLLQQLAGHPNIVRVIEADEDDIWGAYYVMEFIPGASLQALLNRQRVLAPDDVYQVAKLLFDAISHAHRHGMIHRDLKPGNVLLHPVDHTYNLKVIDFGIAKVLNTTTEKLTQTHSAMGTPLYMAPEQWGNEGVGVHSDIYALGTMVYQLLTGIAPFEDQADSIMSLTFAHLKSPPPTFHDLRPDIVYPDGLERAVRTALAKEPAARHADVASFWSALEAPLQTYASTASALISKARAFEESPRTVVELLTSSHASGASEASGAGDVDAPGPSFDDEAFLPTLASQGELPAESRRDEAPPSADHIAQPGPSTRPKPWALWAGACAALLVVVGLSLGAWMGRARKGKGAAGTPASSAKVRAATPRTRPGRPAPPAQTKGPKAGAVRAVSGVADAKAVFIPAGRFIMGSPPGEPGRDPDEEQHRVSLSRGFWMWQTEVTQGQFARLMKYNPSAFKACGPRCPVEQTTFFEALAFANALSKAQGLSLCYTCSGAGKKQRCALKKQYKKDGGKGYYSCKGWRLPTEAEWEYAARAGNKAAYYSGRCLSSKQANFDGRRPPPQCPAGKKLGKTRAVGQLGANPWQLYDMLGNVWEWTWDLYAKERSEAKVTDPVTAGSHLDVLLQQGTKRVLRGGAWSDPARLCRFANRFGGTPQSRYLALGFRVVRSE